MEAICSSDTSFDFHELYGVILHKIELFRWMGFALSRILHAEVHGADHGYENLSSSPLPSWILNDKPTWRVWNVDPS
jgi:reverse gyrase